MTKKSNKHKEKTVFSVPLFGLCKAGATYQRFMDTAKAGLGPNRTLAHMDDIVIFNKTFDEHMISLRALFRKLKEFGIQLKAGKCIFCSHKVELLGFELSDNGIKPQSKLTNSILEFTTPINRREIRRFLGLTGFYRA